MAGATRAQKEEHSSRAWTNSLLPNFPPTPAPVLTSAAQTRTRPSRERPRVQRLPGLRRAGESRCLRRGEGEKLPSEPEVGKAKGFVFHPQTAAMR